MKKNYEKLLINVISLDNADVIATSISVADRQSSLLDAIFDFTTGGLDTQSFSS